MITAFAYIKTEPRATAKLGQAIADLEGVREVYSTMGEYDLMAMLWVRDHEEIATIVTERIGPMAGVLETRTIVAYRAYSTAELNLG